jgi:hypothetical protein
VNALKFSDNPNSLPVLKGVKFPRSIDPLPVAIVLTAMLLNKTLPTLHEKLSAVYVATGAVVHEAAEAAPLDSANRQVPASSIRDFFILKSSKLILLGGPRLVAKRGRVR